MATVSLLMARPHFVGQNAAAVLSTNYISEVMTSSATDQASTLTAREGDVLRIACTGGNVIVDVGVSPDTDTGGFVVLDGSTEFIGVAAGHTVHIQDV